MKRRLKLALALFALALAVGGGLLARWATRTRVASLPPVPVSTVPASWKEFRLGHGHVVHVTKQRIACTECHGAAASFTKPEMQVCVACHEDQAGMKHALHADVQGGMANCADCHNFGPKEHGRADPWACLDCHAKPQGEVHAVTTHADEACKQCHHPHATPAIEPLACVSCHKKAHNEHDPEHASGPQNCLNCHQAHAPAAVAQDRCTECHDDKPHALFASDHGGHERCTDCHRPHDFGVKEVKKCLDCHRNQHVLGQDNPRAQHSCTNCHDPHSVERAGDATCQHCHTQIEPRHPEVKGQSCLTCHAPHPKLKDAPLALACTGCHQQQAANDRSAHGGHAECTSCHKPHSFAHPAAPQVCETCHTPQLTATAKNAGHSTCTNCHKGDIHGANLAPVACATCHTNVHPRTEHAECTKCHEPHSGATRPLAVGCASCHAREVRSVRTQHQNCLTCHLPHEGARRPDAPCESCHAPQAAQNHGHIAGGCTQCHAVHGVKQGLLDTPGCTTCHDVTKLPGLHEVPKHQECKSCHEHGHDTGPFSERQTCTKCHKNKVDHIPEAALCQGCHVFRD